MLSPSTIVNEPELRVNDLAEKTPSTSVVKSPSMMASIVAVGPVPLDHAVPSQVTGAGPVVRFISLELPVVNEPFTARTT